MIKKLSEICSFTMGNAWNAAEFTSEGIPIIRINNMQTNTTEFVYWKGDYHEKYIIKKGDLLVSLSGSIKTFQWEGPEALLNQRIVKVEALVGANQRWIYYQITHVIEQIANKAKHAVIKNVSINDLKNFEIDIPEYELQNKIVTILDKVRSILLKRANTINLLDQLLQSKFLQMFGEKNPNFDKWNEVEIKDYALERKGSMRTGPFGSDLKHDEFTDTGEVAVLGIDNAVNNHFQWDKKRFITKQRYEDNFLRYTVYPRDVVITIMGTVGRTAVIPDDIPLSINTKHLACITLNEKKCNPYYLAYSIHSNPFITFQMKSRNRGAIMEGLNLDVIKHLKLKDVPITEQNMFENIYLKIREKQNVLKNLSETLDNLYNSIMQDAFGGKLKLNISVELDALLKVLNLSKPVNDLYSITTNEEYLQNLVQRLNNQAFDSQEIYDKAKHAAFQLMKDDQNIVQHFDEENQRIKLVLK